MKHSATGRWLAIMLAAALLANASAAMALDPEALDLFDRGARKAKSGDHRGAIDDFTKALKLAPNDAEAYHHRGLSREKSGDPKNAIEDFTGTLALNPKMEEAYYHRGLNKRKLGDLQGAV
ncbi:MAG: tetratricopeptide repeat protein, partial [Nitrospirota bacterium]